MSKLYSPSSAGGTVAGAGGVGGSVGTSVGLTTARRNRNTHAKLKVTYYTLWLARKLEVAVAFTDYD